MEKLTSKYEGIYEDFWEAMSEKGYEEIDMNKLNWQIRYLIWKIKKNL